MAELNLCERCYIKYKQLIEGTIERWLTEPLRDWGTIEHDVTQMVRKVKGVFKDTDPLLLSLDEGEELPDFLSGKVDVKAFRKIGRWGFEKKIKCLKKHGILKEPSYTLLDKLRKIRNKLHKHNYKFTEQELNLLSQAMPIFILMNMAVVQISKKDTVEAYMEKAERSAEKLLLNLQKKK